MKFLALTEKSTENHIKLTDLGYHIQKVRYSSKYEQVARFCAHKPNLSNLSVQIIMVKPCPQFSQKTCLMTGCHIIRPDHVLLDMVQG